VTRTRVAGIVGGIGLLALAVWGGEYGTADWITIRRQLADERAHVAALRIEHESHRARARRPRAVRRDP
jgi:hypothetical protein